MKELIILREKLIDNFYSRVSIGDTFDLFFGGFWLTAHNISAYDEGRLNEFLFSSYKPASEAVDKEDIAKAIVLTATLRKNITGVNLLANSMLECVFENGVKLLFTTDTEFVDWHWAINKVAKDPYSGSIVACFTPGEIQIGKC